MNEQLGWRGFIDGFKREAPNWARTLPQLPRLVHQSLAQPAVVDPTPLLAEIAATQRRQNALLTIIALLLLALLLAPWFY